MGDYARSASCAETLHTLIRVGRGGLCRLARDRTAHGRERFVVISRGDFAHLPRGRLKVESGDHLYPSD